MNQGALVVGASGIIGSSLAQRLVADGWTTYGLARHPPLDIAGVKPVAADLLDCRSLRSGLTGISPTHVFLTTWKRNVTEAENIRVNGAMVRNLLEALSAT